MKSSSQDQTKILKGVGWFLGVSLAIVCALVVFALSDSLAAAISAALPISIFSGISLEQKFQREIRQVETKKTKMMIGSIVVGFIIFIVIYTILYL